MAKSLNLEKVNRELKIVEHVQYVQQYFENYFKKQRKEAVLYRNNPFQKVQQIFGINNY